MSKRPYHRRLPAISCPDCGSPMLTRASDQVTRTMRELLMLCDNDQCGARFVAALSIVRRVEITHKPHPRVDIPTGGWAPSPAKSQANDDSVPANDGPEDAPVDPQPCGNDPAALEQAAGIMTG